MELHLYAGEPGSLGITADGIDMTSKHGLVKQDHEYDHDDCIKDHRVRNDSPQGLGTKGGPEFGNRTSRRSVGINVIQAFQYLARAKGDDECLHAPAYNDAAVNQSNDKPKEQHQQDRSYVDAGSPRRHIRFHHPCHHAGRNCHGTCNGKVNPSYQQHHGHADADHTHNGGLPQYIGNIFKCRKDR